MAGFGHLVVGTVLAVAAAAPLQAQTLYDAASGNLPSASGWSVLQAGAAAVQGVAGGVYSLDTRAPTVGIFGNARLSPVTLDTAAGFDLTFSLRVLDEVHASTNRAGFSLLFVGADPSKSLEVAFWTGNVWAYRYDASNPDRFVHGEDAAYDTTAALRTYTLAVRNDAYTLSVAGQPLLAGSLEDYRAQDLPYTTPNFLFFGDNTTRGRSQVEIGQIVLTPVPEPASGLLAALGLLAIAGWTRRHSRAGSGRGLPSRSIAT